MLVVSLASVEGVKAPILLAVVAFLSFALTAANTRACAHARYAWVAVTDAAILMVNFAIIKHVAEAQTGPPRWRDTWRAGRWAACWVCGCRRSGATRRDRRGPPERTQRRISQRARC